MNSNITMLENNMVSYKMLIGTQQEEINDRIVRLDKQRIMSGYKTTFNDMKRVTGSKILVREQVAQKLYKAQELIKKSNPSLSLYVTYAYRSLEIQTELFISVLKKNTRFFAKPEDLYEEIHRYVAVPDVSGHPTGGAIDAVLYNQASDTFVDFGSEQYDFTNKDCYVFSPKVSKTGRQNRLFLRNILLNVGFAPFNGEWWHFSYGDREWAYYYKKSHAIYSQIALKDIDKFMLSYAYG